MSSENHPSAAKAALTFDRHENGGNGLGIASALMRDLTALRETLFRRVLPSGSDVPIDSMLLPVSKLRAQQQAAEEVEALMVAESAVAVRWFRLIEDTVWFTDWLTTMRFDAWEPQGNVPGRVAEYLEKTDNERRLLFSNIMVEVVPESRRAPLVLFRLLPTAVHVATATAFGDTKNAVEIRREQAKILPSITYCKACHGELLGDGRECPTCGNPLWNHEWLCAVD